MRRATPSHRYYRCRKAFAGPKHDRCHSRYVRADLLEAAVLEEAANVLSRPDIVIAELERQYATPTDNRPEVQGRIDSLERERQRVLRLFQLGEVDEDYVTTESVRIREEQDRLGAQLCAPGMSPPMPDLSNIESVCAQVREFVLSAGPDEVEMVADALQLRITAKTEEAEMTGVIPELYARMDEHPDVCSMVGSIIRIPFELDLTIAA